jgi:hypothetical protein
MTDRPGKWEADPTSSFPTPSYQYASAGNINALRAHKDSGIRNVLMGRAITCWNAAIARGFVCC